MSCYIRPMCQEDVAQVTEIDRAAFPTQFPANYQHELRNRLAHYIVVCDGERNDDGDKIGAAPVKRPVGLSDKLRQLFRHNHNENLSLPQQEDCVIGFAGFWIMADEAHLVSIAVKEAYRGQGIGELLMMSFIEQATELKTSLATLEVRITNTTAQNLYTKYGFIQTGLRRAYYTDNREDALVMSTGDITLDSFQTRFRELKEAYTRKYGTAPASAR